MSYDTTQVNDSKLLVWVIVFSLVLLFTIALGAFVYSFYNNDENSKNAKRIRTLIERAKTDPIAEKRLKKFERKHKRNLKNDRVDKVIIFTFILILMFINLFLCVIPGWLDFINKDYVVYDGALSVETNIYVHKFTRTSTITLGDGTVLTGSLGLEEGQHNKRIVYSKRTEIALWIEEYVK